MTMDFETIKAYWEERASKDATAQSTTQDYYLREIEFRVLKELISQMRPGTVCDVGCGDARTTIKLAYEFSSIRFYGYDYSRAMLTNAGNNLDRAAISNLELGFRDITKPMRGRFEMVFTTRCLINLPTWALQEVALNNIHGSLKEGAVYAMIENFIEGHENFNRLREGYGLPPIEVRDHNLYFERQKLLKAIGSHFDIVKEVNISSTYYLVSRIIYSRICHDRHAVPDYFDEHHLYGAFLPFCGEFGPVRMLVMRRR
jgi:SAM-dependent methyltransferase